MERDRESMEKTLFFLGGIDGAACVCSVRAEPAGVHGRDGAGLWQNEKFSGSIFIYL